METDSKVMRCVYGGKDLVNRMGMSMKQVATKRRAVVKAVNEYLEFRSPNTFKVQAAAHCS